DRNNRPDLRLRVQNAKIEAAGRIADPRLRPPAGIYADLVNPTVWNLTENDLRTLTQPEITARLTARAAGGGLPAIPAAAQIDGAINQARARLEVRLNAVNDRV